MIDSPLDFCMQRNVSKDNMFVVPELEVNLNYLMFDSFQVFLIVYLPKLKELEHLLTDLALK